MNRILLTAELVERDDGTYEMHVTDADGTVRISSVPEQYVTMVPMMLAELRRRFSE